MPRKPSNKIASIDLRVTPEEKREWEEWAAHVGASSFSAWLREAAMKLLAEQQEADLAKQARMQELARRLKGQGRPPQS